MIVARRGDSTRLEAFSDAMMAFASTLLVVSLEVPRTYDELIHNVRGFVPFALTFAALLLIWVAHKNFFRRYPLDDPFTIVVNGALLFTVLFYAFPLKFLAGAFVSIFMRSNQVVLTGPGQLRNLFILYSIGWMLVFGCIALLYRHAGRSPEILGLTPLESYDAITHSRYYLSFVLAGAISFAVAAADIGVRYGVPGMVFVLIGVFTAWNGRHRQRGRPDGSAVASAASTPVTAAAPEAVP